MPNLLHSDEDISDNSTGQGTEVIDTVKVVLPTLRDQTKTVLNDQSTSDETTKVSIRFIPIGATQPVKPQSFQVSRTQTIATILKFLIRRLRLKTVQIYVLSSFQAMPDETLGSLFDTFKTQNELILSYCEQIAYG